MPVLLSLALAASINAFDPSSSAPALAELRAMCASDRDRMWGRSICGPTILVDKSTRAALMSDGSRSEVVMLPPDLPIANTAAEWNGRRWTMVMLPLPQNLISRRVLLAHESFHRIQKDLGLTTPEKRNAHLDSAEGRTWMRMEWRALARALATTGAEQREAVADALTFRDRRRQLVASAAAEERALEINEGLAEYTGVRLAIPSIPDRAAFLVAKLAAAEEGASLVRSFAYASGPAWGTLAETRKRNWTRGITADADLGAVTRAAWRVAPTDVSAASARAARYGFDAVHASELRRESVAAAERAALRAKLVDAPVLILPLRKMNMVFDPNDVRPLDGAGTAYTSITITDEWGRLVATKGALIASDFTHVVVPANGEGVALTLNEGWRKVPGTRTGDERVERTP